MSEEVETPSLITSETPVEETTSTEAPAEASLIAPPEAAPALTFEEITVPEGMEIPEDVRDDFLGIINSAEMSPQERAQALIDLQAKVGTQASEAASQQFQTQQQEWQAEVRNDPEIGGVHFDKTLSGIHRLVDQYGTPEFRQVMAATGAGNNVHVVKFFNALAGKLNEPAAVTGQPAAQSEDAASRLYPSMKG